MVDSYEEWACAELEICVDNDAYSDLELVSLALNLGFNVSTEDSDVFPVVAEPHLYSCLVIVYDLTDGLIDDDFELEWAE